jgi:uncharacterized membrane protein
MPEGLTVTTWMREFGVDALAVLLSVLMVIGYYMQHRSRSRKDPAYSIHSVNARARRLWTQNIMTNPGKELVAIQSLRNYIMVSVMMASTSALLIMGTLTLSGQAQNIIHSWHSLGMFGSHDQALWIIKVLCLLVDFIFAFFSYALSMRLATHVLFMINVPEAGYRAHPELSCDCVADRLVRSGNMMAIGMRAFLFAIPLVFWLFGPVFLVLATGGLVITLNRLDRHEAASSRASHTADGRTIPACARKPGITA